MTFNQRSYVPVLKLKRGEKQALAEIVPALRQWVVPLLEVVARTQAPTVDKHLTTSFRDLAFSLQGYPRCLLDVGEIENDGPEAAEAAFRRASDAGILFTPVTGVSRTADVVSAVSRSNVSGVGIRLTRQDFEGGYLAANLNSFLSGNNLTPDRVDLIVDLGPVYSLITAGVMALTRAFLADVPNKSKWRTLTVTGSAFPLSMGVVDRNSSLRVPRSEWIAWRDGLYNHRAELKRLPTFSDSAIQHPVGVEDFDPRFMQISATIRYTSNDDWLLVKGESTRSNLPSNQFPQLATQLVYGRLRNDFAGEKHCTGCRMVRRAADGSSGLGSAEVWRKIGTIHHITTVVQNDLLVLPWP